MAHRVAWYTSEARGGAGWPRRWPVEAVNDEVPMAEEVDGGGSLWVALCGCLAHRGW
jgi:hypothetical protein